MRNIFTLEDVWGIGLKNKSSLYYTLVGVLSIITHSLTGGGVNTMPQTERRNVLLQLVLHLLCVYTISLRMNEYDVHNYSKSYTMQSRFSTISGEVKIVR